MNNQSRNFVTAEPKQTDYAKKVMQQLRNEKELKLDLSDEATTESSCASDEEEAQVFLTTGERKLLDKMLYE